MATTSSFKINNNIYINYACFSMFKGNSPDTFIIIEKHKQFFSKKIINEWLDDLQKLGLPIESYSIQPDLSYHILLKKTTDRSLMILTGILVRCLWEGLYKRMDEDNFFLVIKGYFKLKKYNLGYTIMEMICLSINYYYLMKQFTYTNINHILSSNYGCIIYKTLPNNIININSTFEIMTSSNLKTIKFNIPKRWTKNKFKELYEKLITNSPT